MTDWLSQLSSIWILILIMLVLIIALVVIILSSVVRRSEEAEISVAARGPAPVPVVPQEGALELTGPAESAASSFSRAMRFLRSTVSGRDYRYQIPWYLVIGDPDSGKSALMRGVGANLSGAGGNSRSPLEWRFLDRGILIAVAGRYFLGGTSKRGPYSWSGLLRLLQNNRPRRPLDGIVLTVPASDLIGASALDEAKLSARAARFGEMLAQAQRTLGFIFPVYVVVTKCDEIAGFSSFCRELPQKNRDDIFGWSSPYQLDASFGPEWVDEAFNGISQDLQRLQSEILVERSELRDPDSVFLFPEEFAALRSPMGIYLERLFRETAYREAFRFRGLYFCGDISKIAASEPLPEIGEEPSIEQLLPEIAPPETPKPVLSVRKSPVFVKRLFEEKIFAENGLARPLARVFLTKSRTAAYVQAAAALLAVVLLAGTWLSYRRLAGDRDRLLPALEKMTGAIPKSETSAAKKAFGLGLLQNLNTAGSVNFWSPFQPASWSSPIDDNVTLVMKTACEQWVFSAFQADLVQRKTALLYPQLVQPAAAGAGGDQAPADAPDDPQATAQPDAAQAAVEPSSITNLESAGEYQGLVDFVTQLQSLEEAISTYEDLRQQGQSATPDRIRKLLAYMDLPGIEPSGHLALALVEATGPSAAVTTTDVATASDAIRQRIGDLLHDWFENNEAWDDVKELQRSVSSVQSGRVTSYQGLTDLLNLINQTQNDFTDPNFHWLSNTSMDLPGALKRVSVNPLAGPKSTDMAAYSRLLGEDYFNQLRNKLRDARTSMGGVPLLDLSKSPIDLSTQTKQIQLALQNTINLPFMGPAIVPKEIQVNLDANRRLIWRADPLHEAQRLYSFYAGFDQDGLRNTPETLAASLRHLALSQLAPHVQDLIAQAQTFQSRSTALTGTTADDETLQEVNAFRDAAGPLEQLAEQFSGKDHVSIHNAVLRIMVLQAYNLLTILDARLRNEHPYTNKPGAWNGSGSLSFAVFGVNSLPALNTYLGLQREQVHFIEQQAEPLIPFLSKYMPVQASDQIQLIAKWKVLIEDFQQYANKGTSSTLASLEDFITTGIDKIPADACQTAAPEGGADYFAQIHDNLEKQLSNRCRDVTASTVCGAYGAIAAQFNEKLANKFPFTSTPVPAGGNEAAGVDVTAFYQTVDAKGKAAYDGLKASLNDSARFGDDGRRARQFLDGMDGLRLIALPASAETEKEPAFTMDVSPQFRVNRANESGGNQIIDWGMQMGGQIFQQKDPEHSGRWHPGNPIRLSLRWANDSIYVPVADSSQPDLVIRDRNAYFEFTNRWSLLSFLRRHEVAPSDLGQNADPIPYTLKLRVKTASDPKWAAASGKPLTGSATVFVHLKIMQAGKKDPITIPAFPVAAPQLVTGCEQF